MNRATLRAAIVVLTLITAVVHLVVLNIGIYQLKGGIDPLFTLNGLGYLVLLGVLVLRPSFLAGNENLVHWAFIAYTAVTIIAWVAIGSKNTLGFLTKLDEVLLILALFGHMRAEGVGAPA